MCKHYARFADRARATLCRLAAGCVRAARLHWPLTRDKTRGTATPFVRSRLKIKCSITHNFARMKRNGNQTIT